MNELAYQQATQRWRQADTLWAQLTDLYGDSAYPREKWPIKAKMDGAITQEEYSLLKHD